MVFHHELEKFETYDAFISYSTKTTEVINQFFNHDEESYLNKYHFIKLHGFFFPAVFEGKERIFSTNITIETNVYRYEGEYDVKYTIDQGRMRSKDTVITFSELKSQYLSPDQFYDDSSAFERYVQALILKSGVIDLKRMEQRSVKVKDFPILDESMRRLMIPKLRAQGEYARWQGYGRSSEFQMTEFEFKRII